MRISLCKSKNLAYISNIIAYILIGMLCSSIGAFGLLSHNHTERCNFCGQANVINPSKTQAS